MTDERYPPLEISPFEETIGHGTEEIEKAFKVAIAVCDGNRPNLNVSIKWPTPFQKIIGGEVPPRWTGIPKARTTFEFRCLYLPADPGHPDPDTEYVTVIGYHDDLWEALLAFIGEWNRLRALMPPKRKEESGG